MLRGALYETYVAQNLAALLEAHLPEAQMGYWHEQGRHEVDFVIEVGRKVFAIEVKAATRWSQNDLSGLKAFLERTPACAAAVLAYNHVLLLVALLFVVSVPLVLLLRGHRDVKVEIVAD